MREINLVPFMDILLVLLVIFMVGAPLAVQGIDLQLPSTQTKPIANADDATLLISVDVDGNWILENKAQTGFAPLSDSGVLVAERNHLRVGYSDQSPNTQSDSKERFLRHLALENERNKKFALMVRGDARAPYASVARLMAELQSRGITNIHLLTASAKGESE